MEQSYECLEEALIWKLTSSEYITFEATLDTFGPFLRASYTPLTDREKVSTLSDPIENNDAMLTVHTANFNGDLRGEECDFSELLISFSASRSCEGKLSKLGTKRSYDALVSSTSLAGRGSALGIDLRWFLKIK